MKFIFFSGSREIYSVEAQLWKSLNNPTLEGVAYEKTFSYKGTGDVQSTVILSNTLNKIELLDLKTGVKLQINLPEKAKLK